MQHPSGDGIIQYFMTQNICLFEKLTQSNHPSEAQQEIALEGETSSGMHQDEG